MWRNFDIRVPLVNCTGPEIPFNIRSQAVAVVWALTTNELNREPMWDDERIRQVLETSIAADQRSILRVYALNAIKCLGATSSLQGELWNNANIQFTLLQSVSVGQP